jgi:hypothetical protein
MDRSGRGGGLRGGAQILNLDRALKGEMVLLKIVIIAVVLAIQAFSLHACWRDAHQGNDNFGAAILFLFLAFCFGVIDSAAIVWALVRMAARYGVR